MDEIEEIWQKGNEQIARDKSFDSDAVRKSISESSTGILSGMSKTLWLGVCIALLAGIMFIINIFFYTGNLAILIPIIILLIISVLLITFLLIQIGVIRRMDTLELNLHNLLVYKIKYLNTRFNLALHCVSLSIVLATFTINLTMESNDGIFELRKILILSAFYLFVYIMTFILSKLTHRVYDRQLRNALSNLEENTLKNIDKVLKRHKMTGRIIAVVMAILVLSGVAALLIFT